MNAIQGADDRRCNSDCKLQGAGLLSSSECGAPALRLPFVKIRGCGGDGEDEIFRWIWAHQVVGVLDSVGGVALWCTSFCWEGNYLSQHGDGYNSKEGHSNQPIRHSHQQILVEFHRGTGLGTFQRFAFRIEESNFARASRWLREAVNKIAARQRARGV